MGRSLKNAPLQSGSTDARFANFQSDPRFRLPSKKHTRVPIDKRFSRMLQDDDFSGRPKVDRYGRRLESESGRKELERFYRIEREDEEQSGDEKHAATDKAERQGGAAELAEEDEVEDDEEVRRELLRVQGKYDPARDGGFSSSEEDSEEVTSDEESQAEGELNLPYETDVPMGEVSSRLAAVNLDWDNIKAVDLMAVAASFVPSDGKILDVSIYPSEFGRERLDREQYEGPPREIFANTGKKADMDSDGDSVESASEDEAAIREQLVQEDKGEEYSSKALRAYQLERLRYYYAVITCSSINAAKALYDAMDGREYLSSANFFDLRFIPDSVSFDSDRPRDSCTEMPDTYNPTEFITDALTHSRVKLTWDADDPARKEVQKRAFSRAEIDENDLQAYIGSESSGEEEAIHSHIGSAVQGKANNEGSKAEKAAALRAALGLPSEKSKSSRRKSSDAPVGDLQVTWASGLSGPPQRTSVFANAPEETTREKYIRKEKERKARRKEKVNTARNDDPNSSIAGDMAMPHDAGQIRTEKEEHRDENAASDPFDDPFFTDPAGATTAARKARRAKKQAERSQKDGENSEQRAELELLMAEDDGVTSAGINHFDMREVLKSEKASRRSGKKKDADENLKNKHRRVKSGNKVLSDERGREDDFAIDVADPRFTSIYERHEYAIDPTNPRFKGTEGMNAVLEEGRKRRAKRARSPRREHENEIGTEYSEIGGRKKKRQSQFEGAVGQDKEDISKLVQRVKARTGKA